MPGPADRAERVKGYAEARFRVERGAKDAAAEAGRRVEAEREKTARLRALRLARDEAEKAAEDARPPTAVASPKPGRKSKKA